MCFLSVIISRLSAGTMISGRYYAKVPPGAGHIMMYDARRWASEDITIYPREGEMLIFPR
jgi:hypothetical protein